MNAQTPQDDPRQGAPSCLGLALLGALGAVLPVFPCGLVASMTIPASTHEQIQGMSEVFALGMCVLMPLAAVLGVLAGLGVAWTRGRVTPPHRAGLSSLLVGLAVGVILVAVAYLWFRSTCGPAWSLCT